LILGRFAAAARNGIQRPDDARMPADRSKDRQEVLDPYAALAFDHLVDKIKQDIARQLKPRFRLGRIEGA